ncbi:hypothetical protein Cs7R123_40540 [Catellatospora sp. TT07R-123]|uniref:putative bifunctional diguanylate cyclase/phosphodiesterase n=1 Tax=Catellatospora sp. TT07R-123 TaxID=2733863 RepID=UPI001B055FF6|nr:bifunctional diguanylate cyclase/phosphodiesterase [Catellatospora sp. TT07R-123]GHJ46712.1 hypothetical protein Cs7R123_40540 [Catellatospora sp. TT07R-123]
MADQTNTSQQTDRQLRLLVGLVASLGAVIVLASLGFALTRPVGSELALRAGGMALLVMLATLTNVQVRIRSNHHNVHWADAALLVAAALLPMPWAVLAAVVGSTAARAVNRMASPMRFVFAVAKETVICGIAAAVLSLAPSAAQDPVHHLGLLALAYLAAQVADDVIALPVIALATQTSLRDRFLADPDLRWGSALVRFAVAVLTLVVLKQEPQLLIVIPVIVLSLHLTHRGRVRARAERKAWQQLAEATDALNAVQLDEVLRKAVRNAATLFSADTVEVEIRLPGLEQLVSGTHAEILYQGTPTHVPPDPARTAVVPLGGDGDSEKVGELRLCFQRPVSLSEREQLTLRAFAGALGTSVRNATSFVQLEQLADKYAHDATHDPLTGLPNRRLLRDEVTLALDTRGARRGVTALLVLDLNHFKEINDALGHGAGDQVLVTVARRLEEAAGTDALVSRLGGDEFAVLYRSVPTPALAQHRAEALLKVLQEPVEIDGMPMVVSASAGVATAPSTGGFVELLRRADIAMYQAKRTGRMVAVYAPDRDTADRTRLVVGGMLPRAVAQREFTLEFQPIVDMASGATIGAEALARWQHPDRGRVEPRSFLEPIERSGLLTAFTDAVLDQALAGAARWRAAGCRWPVAVNISPRSLLDRRLPALVATRLDDHGLPGDALMLELTESHNLSPLDVVDQVLAELTELGCELALDDFGTGYSSLSVLARIQARELKIDRSFVVQMEHSISDAAVVRSTVELANHLDLLVVAEGVERESQRQMLWKLGCTAGQGHLFAKPMPLPALMELIDSGKITQLAEPLHRPGAVVQLPQKRRNPGRGTGTGRVSDSTA